MPILPYPQCNYGQYFVWSDKLFKSFRVPAKGDDPLLAVLAEIEKKRLAVEASAAAEAERLGLPSPVHPSAAGMKRVDSGLGSETESVEGKKKRAESEESEDAASSVDEEVVVEASAVKPRREGLRERK